MEESFDANVAICGNFVLSVKNSIGMQERHHIFKGPMQLNYNLLVFTHFYGMVMFQFA